MNISIERYNRLPNKQKEAIEALCTRSFVTLEKARANMVIDSMFPDGDVTIIGINNKNPKITRDGYVYY
jgi:hypothetical protein